MLFPFRRIPYLSSPSFFPPIDDSDAKDSRPFRLERVLIMPLSVCMDHVEHPLSETTH